MAKDKKLVEAITAMEDDFAQWYTDVVKKAELADYSSVRGCMILRPNGYAIWENIQRIMDAEFKKTGHENVAMPVLIPESLLKKEGELVNGFAQAAKFAEVNPYFSPDLRLKLGAVTLIYDAANNWIKDVTHNSPTTYQLLPSVEYLKLMPQLYENEFKRGTAVTTASQYYSILNGSTNINSNLTNGNNRSHRYFRETVLGGDIVSVLQTVDTVLVASDSADKKTPVIANYSSKLFGGTKLKEIIFKGGNSNKNNEPSGDGTVAY